MTLPCIVQKRAAAAEAVAGERTPQGAQGGGKPPAEGKRREQRETHNAERSTFNFQVREDREVGEYCA